MIRFKVLCWRLYYWLFTDFCDGITLREFLFEEDVEIDDIKDNLKKGKSEIFLGVKK